MLALAQILFWLSILALLHSYGFYPWWMRGLARGKKPHGPVFGPFDAGLPRISVLMSVYNEEKVLAAKIASLKKLAYPSDKLFFYFGSDGSADGSNAILAASGLQNLHFFPFEERRGKPPVINDLAEKALESGSRENHVLLLTDANVLLHEDVPYHLVKHFRDETVGAVDAHMRSVGLREEGISRSEERYLSGEVLLKHHESLAWGMMMGPFGGCYALRADLFEPVPPHSLVDDFWLVFRVLEKGFKAINDLDAVCYEGATHRVGDEFKRKKRIAAGSFQNLARFKRWVLPPFSKLGFAFFSHKVLRWFGGFLLLIAWLCAGILAFSNQLYLLLFCGLSLLLVGIPLLDVITQKMGRPNILLRNIAYFIAMNAALMAGFFKWQSGIKENTWQRTTRY
ncbi:MAG: glycosyltransferase [Saprospiraceae bacterium]|nr:glycosyltransferase [Saprospiraceae bacterium]